ncbi:MAG TPA: hypothetical protein DEP05_04860, partial [Betaproteobacteria bacterium]|nr:hypothetical protein [Betaproteobacteria bacterium]
ALQGELVRNVELTIIPKQGSPRLVVVSGHAFFDDAGNKLGAVVSTHEVTERRQAEKALQQSENRFRALMQQAGDALVVCDLQGRILDANQAACDLSGYRRDELAKLAMTDLVQGSARDALVAILMRLEAGRPVTLESEQRRKDAVAFPVEVRVGLIDMPGQRVAMALIRDISARKKAEQALHKANRAYQALSDCDMAIAKATAERALLQKVCRILVERCGYRFVWIGFPQHDRKKGVKPVAHAGFDAGFLDGLDIRWSDTEKGRGPLGAAIRKGKVAVVRSIQRSAKFTPWRKQAMKRGYASVAALPLIHGKETLGVLAIYAEIADAFDADELQLLRGLAHDIAYGIATLRTREERRRAEQSLRDSEEKHRLLFETMSQGVVYQDARGRILSANPSAEAILGFHLGKMRKSAPAIPSWRAIHEDGSDFPAEMHPAMDALATGRVVTDIVMGVIHPPARGNRWILVSATPQWRPGEKKPYQVYSTFTDITERRQVAAELQEYRDRLEDLVAERTRELTAVNKELEAFSYSVSHDLRAPLRSINGFSLALLEDYGGKFDEQAQDYLVRVSDGARRMGELIDDMLTLSRITRREMRLEPLDLSAIAEDITAGLVHSGTGRDVEIAVMPNLSAIGDRGLMRIVLENLLGNAWKFTGKRQDARLEFGAALIDGQHTFYVKDNGAGFEMAYADKLFGAFQRLHAYTEFEGTGVGLATVQRAIRRHGGEVWGEGAVNEGATFYFRLPA